MQVHPRAICEAMCSSIDFYHLIIHLNNNTLTRVKRRKVKSTCDLINVKSGLCELLHSEYHLVRFHVWNVCGFKHPVKQIHFTAFVMNVSG